MRRFLPWLFVACVAGCAMNSAQRLIEQWQLQYPGLQAKDLDGDGRPDVVSIPVAVATQPGQPPQVTQTDLPGSAELLAKAQAIDDKLVALQQTWLEEYAPWLFFLLLMGGAGAYALRKK